MATTTVSFRTDAELRKDAEKFFETVGMTMSTAINLYLRKIVMEQRIPFEISVPVMSRESISALNEAEELKKPGVGKVFKNVDELREDLLS
ncbi:MAG: type II toxin-antitoxin system RelB/DinJ family antitoxin [Lentisphaeria bacterium]|nr:type II toxin-antitoxin system RelB/DinJ family antitoxin [Lentisphaeria bacterium]